MSTLIELLQAKHKDGARGEGGYYDCWGLTRYARHVLYGKPLLPQFAGQYQQDLDGFTGHYQSQAKHMLELTEPRDGCIAAVLRRGVLCVHVALVVKQADRLYVLETNPHTNARIVPLQRFIDDNAARTIKYYDD